tara:strand:+ start:190 stop:570 length:381 start_codon:yes stop_codon:yes gene_type:complete
MSNLIKTLNKINDSKTVALKSEVLELAMKGADSFAKESESTYKSALKVQVQALKEAKSKVSAELKKLSKIRVEAFKAKSEFESKAKGLGIDPSKLKQPKAYKKVIDDLDKRFDFINESIKGFSKFM